MRLVFAVSRTHGLPAFGEPVQSCKGVGPNAANLTKITVLSPPYVFRVEAVGMPPGTYVCYFYDDSPSRDFSFDIPAYPW